MYMHIHIHTCCMYVYMYIHVYVVCMYKYMYIHVALLVLQSMYMYMYYIQKEFSTANNIQCTYTSDSYL